MSLFVQKFGGSSVADLERIRHVAEIILETKKLGHSVVIVVSAMLGETDRLIQLANSITDEDPREYAALIASGEQVSAALLSMVLTKMGHPAYSMTGAQAGIYTTDDPKKARITDIDTAFLQAQLALGRIPVVSGFQGIREDNSITTLGRGGSDLTAVAIAAALKADECQIYTDVDGVYTSDPKIVPKAKRLDKLSCDEMLELAGLGAKVLQNRCIEFAGKYRVPVRVLSSLKQGSGTLITLNEESAEQPLVSAVATDRDQAQLTIRGVPKRPGLASYILGAIAKVDIEVDMIVQSLPSKEGLLDFGFIVHERNYADALKILRVTAKELAAEEVIGNQHVAKLSLVGVGMRSHTGIAAKMLSTLGKEGVDVSLINATDIKISAIMDEKYLELGARSLHTAFGLDRE